MCAALLLLDAHGDDSQGGDHVARVRLEHADASHGWCPFLMEREFDRLLRLDAEGDSGQGGD